MTTDGGPQHHTQCTQYMNKQRRHCTAGMTGAGWRPLPCPTLHYPGDSRSGRHELWSTEHGRNHARLHTQRVGMPRRTLSMPTLSGAQSVAPPPPHTHSKLTGSYIMPV